METAVGKKARLSMDDILDAISQVASDPDDPKRMTALKLLSGMSAGNVVLPPPMSTEERIERLARLMKALSKEQCKIAYRQAYPHAKDEVNGPVALYDDILTLDEIKLCNRCTSYRLLIKHFPECKTHAGMIVGTPIHSGAAAKVEFFRKQARLALIHRKKKDLAEPAD